MEGDCVAVRDPFVLHRLLPIAVLVAVAICGARVSYAAAAENAKQIGPEPKAYQQTVDRAIEYFRQAQGEDGSYSKQAGTGVTALVATALMRNGKTSFDPLVAKSLKFLESQVRDDGGVYTEGSRHRIYDTCLVIQC